MLTACPASFGTLTSASVTTGADIVTLSGAEAVRRTFQRNRLGERDSDRRDLEKPYRRLQAPVVMLGNGGAALFSLSKQFFRDLRHTLRDTATFTRAASTWWYQWASCAAACRWLQRLHWPLPERWPNSRTRPFRL